MRGLSGHGIHLFHLIKCTHYSTNGRERAMPYPITIIGTLFSSSVICTLRICPQLVGVKSHLQLGWKKKDMHVLSCWFSFLKIELIGMTLVNKTMQVSSIQLKRTSSAHRIVRLPPKVKSLFSLVCPLFAHLYLPPPSLPSGYHHTVVQVYVSYECVCVCV